MRFICAFISFLFLICPAHAFFIGGTYNSPTLRACTDRSMVMGYSTSHVGNTLSEARNLFMTGKYNCKNPRFIYANWGLSVGETAGFNAFRMRAVYESGATTIEAKYQNTTPTLLNPGDNKRFDPVPITISANSSFWVRNVQEVPVNTERYFVGPIPTSAGGVGSNLLYSDRTLETSQILNTGSYDIGDGEYNNASYTFLPVSIVGEVKEGSIAIITLGDSIDAGVNDNRTGSINYDVGFISRGLRDASDGMIPNTNFSRASRSLPDTVAPYECQLLKYYTHAVVGLGTNNIGFNSFESMKSKYISYWASIRDCGPQYVAQRTLLPRTVSWVDQTPFNSGYEKDGVKDQLNTWFYTQVGGALDAVIPIAEMLEDPEDSSKWNTSGEQLAHVDGTHPLAAAYLLAKTEVTTWANGLTQAAGDVP